MILTIDNIKHNYGNTQFNYNTEIPDGITGIFGTSGAGKTTLMNILCGIQKPSSGKLIFRNNVFFDDKRKINIPENKRNIGVAFQNNYLFPHLNVKQNLLYSNPYIKKKKKMIDFDILIDLLDISHLLKNKPFQLSGGECQRVAIGRTLLSQPQLLLMDEPFSNLDKKRREEIISYLLQINHSFGLPIIIISHDLEDLIKLTRYLIVIHNGEVKFSGNYQNNANYNLMPDLIPREYYLNTFELYYTGYNENEGLYYFSSDFELKNVFLKTQSYLFNNKLIPGKKVRFTVSPDNLVLNTDITNNTSMQNRIKGKVKKITNQNNSYYVTVDCGIDLVAKVTKAAVNKMNIRVGNIIYCMIKANAVEVIHIYDSRKNMN
jgi:molybdate transport system ATP-binding protein